MSILKQGKPQRLLIFCSSIHVKSCFYNFLKVNIKKSSRWYEETKPTAIPRADSHLKYAKELNYLK